MEVWNIRGRASDGNQVKSILTECDLVVSTTVHVSGQPVDIVMGFLDSNVVVCAQSICLISVEWCRLLRMVSNFDN